MFYLNNGLYSHGCPGNRRSDTRSPYIPFLLFDWLAHCFSNTVAYSLYTHSFLQLLGEASEDMEILANEEEEQMYSIAKISG